MSNSTIVRENLRDRIDAILPTLAANVPTSESERSIPRESAQLMIDAGIARLLVPRRFGGDEVDLKEWADAIRAIAAVDASHGWLASLYSHNPFYIAQFAESAQEEVWANGPDVPIASSIGPTCTVTAVDDGYRISGQSSFASGVDHAEWVIVAGMLPGVKPPMWTFFLIPGGQYTVTKSWETIAMRGTGSNTIVTEDVFVPESRVLRVADLREGRGPGSGIHDKPYYRAPWVTYAPATFVTPILGAVTGAFERFRAWTAARATAQGSSVAKFASVQTRLARAAADIDAAELLLLRALEVAQAPTAPTLELRARNFRDLSRAAELLTEVIDTIMTLSGSAGFSESNDIQRMWRDVHMAASHTSLNPEQSFAHWSRLHLGVEREPSLQLY